MPKLHEPTEKDREIVQLHATIGTPQDAIARIIGIAEKTLRLHYRDELDLGRHRANAEVGGHLYKKACNGDTAAQIFWMKTQAGWSEKTILAGDPGAPIKHEVTLDASKLSTEALREIVALKRSGE